MKLREHVSYANIAATLALVVAIGGSGGAAYAVAKNSIRSKHIENGQVKTVDLKKGAVKARKLSPNAVSSSKIVDGTIATADLGAVAGVATAGAGIQADGTVRSWFNRLGDAVSVDKFGTGAYSVLLPGHTPTWESTVVAVAPTASGFSCSWDLDAVAAVDVHCWTSSTGDPADAGFSLLVY